MTVYYFIDRFQIRVDNTLGELIYSWLFKNVKKVNKNLTK